MKYDAALLLFLKAAHKTASCDEGAHGRVYVFGGRLFTPLTQQILYRSFNRLGKHGPYARVHDTSTKPRLLIGSGFYERF